jgi:MFS family permease
MNPDRSGFDQYASAATAAKNSLSPHYKWYVVGMLWLICFFNYADRQAIFSIFPLLKANFGFNPEQLGWIGAAFTWVYALTAPVAGQVGDHFSRKAVILGGLYIWSAITGCTALCSKVWHFVLVRASEGLGETFYFPASMSLVSDYHDKATRSRAMSLHQTSVYMGTVGGGALAGWLAVVWGWQSPFLMLAAAGILLGLVLATSIHEPQRNQAERRAYGNEATPGKPQPLPMAQFVGELIQTPTALLLIGAFFGANFVALVFLTWMPTFLNERFGLTLAWAGLGATFFIQVASMIGAVVGGILADRWKRRRAGGRICVQGLGTLLGAPFIFLCGYTQDMGVLILAMTFFGFAKGLYDANIWASLYDVVAPARRGTAVGLMNMIGWLGGGLGSLAIGVAVNREIPMSVAIASTAAIYVLVTFGLFFGAFVLAPRDAGRAGTGTSG